MTTDTEIFDEFLRRYGLMTADEQAQYQPLTGGVSSDIYRVDLPHRSLCIKRALPKLKVAADWEAPVSRSSYEWRWVCFVAEVLPDAVPRPLAHDAASGLFAMDFLGTADHVLWKAQLLAGVVNPETAAAIGRVVGRIHAASTRAQGIAERFDSDDNFHALRIDPYLLETGRRHPALASRLAELATQTAARKYALVHGDVSPKNILIGPKGPVILDAECAWFGDPAFDLAFCLNHLLLKAIVVPGAAVGLLESFLQLMRAYLDEVTWEATSVIEARTAALLPALLLARVDGKSPVEYLVDEEQRETVRRFATPLILTPVDKLARIAELWYRDAAHD